MPLLAAVIAIAAYAHTLGFEFVYDDIPLIKENPSIRSLAALPSLFMQEDMLDDSHTGYYRPLVSVMDALVYVAFGPSPAVFHAMNIAYHAIAVALLYFLALRLLGSAEAAFVASALFAAHPLNTESVAFITGKNNLLCGIFTLGSILAYMRYMERSKMRWLALSSVLFLAGLLCKEFAIMAPVAILLIGYMRHAGRPRPGPIAAYALAAALYVLMRVVALGGLSGSVSPELGGLPARLAGMIDVLAIYLRLTFLPVGQRALYDISLDPSLLSLANAIPVVAVIYAAWRLRRVMPEASFGIAWFFLFLAPVMNVMPVSGSPMAERFLYIPLMGMAIAAGRVTMSARVNRVTMRYVAAAMVLALFASTIARAQVWRTDETLYTHMSATAPNAYKGHYNLGNLRFKQGRLEEAAALWSRALEARPEMFAVHNNLGALYNRIGKYERAERHLRAVLSVRIMPEVYINLARALAGQGRVAEAADAYRRAIAMDAKGMPAYLGYADMLDRAGRVDDALAVLNGGILNSPSDYRPWNLAGAIAGKAGRYAAAYELFSRALDLEPSCEECEYNMNQLKRAITGGMRDGNGG